MNYGRAIRTIRSAKGITQKELANSAKLNSSYVSLLESGARNPSAPTLEVISNALKVPLYLLMFLASEKRELKNISPSQASHLGKQILNVLMFLDSKNQE